MSRFHLRTAVKPAVVRSTDEVTVVGTVFRTPLVVKGKTWLPVAELITWPVMAWAAKKTDPGTIVAAESGDRDADHASCFGVRVVP